MAAGNAAAPRDILVIDDSTTVLKVYERAFATTPQLKDFRLINFTSAGVALDWLEKHPGQPIAAILLDRIMEGMDGLQMFAKLKGDARWKDIPVVMSSSMGEHAKVLEAIKAGASDYIVKPLSSAVLAEKLIRVLAAKAARLG